MRICRIHIFLLFLFIEIPCLSHLQAQILTPTVDSIPMRDGKKLAADIHRPSACTQCPTILIQTPYNRLLYRFGLPLGIGLNLNSSNYNIVIVDRRGFYGSFAALVANPNLGEDGYDAVEWIAAQTWSDTMIGTWGPSALGLVQYQTAREQPPHLVCSVPLVAAPQTLYHSYYPGGVYRKEYMDQLDGLGFGVSATILAAPHYNLAWQFAENNSWYPSDIAVPMLMIGGWYDHNINEMIDFFEAIRLQSPITVRNQHKIWIGPWVHGGNGIANPGTAQQGELTYPGVAGVIDSIAIAFFDYHLRGINNAWNNAAPLHYYKMGQDVWDTDNSWIPATITQNWYLNDGELLDTLQSSPGTASLTYDPADPSPTYGGPTLRIDQVQGPWNQADTIELRGDNLIFTTAEFTQDLTVKGSIRIHLYVSSDRPDTDVAVRLTDVYPDNRSILLLDGIQRMRFRNGYTTSDTASMQVGTIYPIIIELTDVAHTFLAGHKLRLVITGSNYPRFNNNLNNGGAMYVAGDTLVATNSIHFDATHLSHIALPIVPNQATFIQELTYREISIYPNPTKEYFYLDLRSLVREETFRYEICDINGRLLMQQNCAGLGIEVVDIAHLNRGVYVLRLYSKDKKWMKKIIKI